MMMNRIAIILGLAALLAAPSGAASGDGSALGRAKQAGVPGIGEGVDATPADAGERMGFVEAGALSSADAESVPKRYRTDSPAVNARLGACLRKLNCRVTGSAGIGRDPSPSNRCQYGRSRWSCHLLREAIDITSATCDMAKLRDCLDGVRFRACWNGKGGCLSESGVLHFGNHEALCMPRVWAKYGSCPKR